MGMSILDLNAGVVPTVTTNYDVNGTKDAVKSLHVTYTSTTASFSVQPQISLDGTNFYNIGTATTISNSSGTTVWHEIHFPEVPYVRLKVTKTSGALTTFQAYAAVCPRGAC